MRGPWRGGVDDALDDGDERPEPVGASTVLQLLRAVAEGEARRAVLEQRVLSLEHERDALTATTDALVDDVVRLEERLDRVLEALHRWRREANR